MKPDLPEQDVESLHDHAPVHIFTTASSMVGVCLTAIGLIQVLIGTRTMYMIADDLLALDSILFLTSALLSYMSIRSKNRKRYHRLELIADRVFIAAMLLMVVACIALAYQIEFSFVASLHR